MKPAKIGNSSPNTVAAPALDGLTGNANVEVTSADLATLFDNVAAPAPDGLTGNANVEVMPTLLSTLFETLSMYLLFNPDEDNIEEAASVSDLVSAANRCIAQMGQEKEGVLSESSRTIALIKKTAREKLAKVDAQAKPEWATGFKKALDDFVVGFARWIYNYVRLRKTFAFEIARLYYKESFPEQEWGEWTVSFQSEEHRYGRVVEFGLQEDQEHDFIDWISNEENEKNLLLVAKYARRQVSTCSKSGTTSSNSSSREGNSSNSAGSNDHSGRALDRPESDKRGKNVTSVSMSLESTRRQRNPAVDSCCDHVDVGGPGEGSETYSCILKGHIVSTSVREQFVDYHLRAFLRNESKICSLPGVRLLSEWQDVPARTKGSPDQRKGIGQHGGNASSVNSVETTVKLGGVASPTVIPSTVLFDPSLSVSPLGGSSKTQREIHSSIQAVDTLYLAVSAALPVSLNGLYKDVTEETHDGRSTFCSTAQSLHVSSKCVACITHVDLGNENQGTVWNIQLVECVSGTPLITRHVCGESPLWPPTSGWLPTMELRYVALATTNDYSFLVFAFPGNEQEANGIYRPVKNKGKKDVNWLSRRYSMAGSFSSVVGSFFIHCPEPGKEWMLTFVPNTDDHRSVKESRLFIGIGQEQSLFPHPPSQWRSCRTKNSPDTDICFYCRLVKPLPTSNGDSDEGT